MSSDHQHPTEISYNKFKDYTTVNNTNNWVHKISGCKELAFNFSTIFYDEKSPSDPTSHICGISIQTEASTQISIGEGCHLWIFADGRKIDILCESYSGTKNMVVKTTCGNYGVYSSTSVEYDESSLFVTDLKTLCELSEANQIWFEIETGSRKVIKGTFNEKNHASLRNFVRKASNFNSTHFQNNFLSK